MAKTEKQTHEWLTMSEASERLSKSQATIRAALHKHSAFVRGENWREIKPTLRFPDGSERPGSGRANIVVRADVLQQWASESAERASTPRSAGVVYKINLVDAKIEPGHAEDIAEQLYRLNPEMTIREAVEILLRPFDVNLRRATTPRQPKDESNGTTGHESDATPGPPQESFEFELVES